MPRVNVMESRFGANNTGLVNTQPAIQLAITAAGPNGIVYFPAGNYLITDPVVAYVAGGGVSFQGDGHQSRIIVKLTDATKEAIRLNQAPPDPAHPGFPGTGVSGLLWSDIAILGAKTGTGYCCRVGLLGEVVLRSVFRNVHVLVGASEHAIYLRTGWSNQFNFVSSMEFAEQLYGDLPGYPAGTKASPPLLTHIRCGPGSYLGGLNANVFDCLVEGSVCDSLGADLLHFEPQDWTAAEPKILAQGNNVITGTYEGTKATWLHPNAKCPPPDPRVSYYTGYAVVLKGCTLPSLRDFHLEHTGGLVMENCESPTVEQGAVQDVTLTGTTRALIDQVTVSNLTIGETCSFTRLGAIGLEGVSGIYNRSLTTVSLGSIRDLNERAPATGERVRQTAGALANPENLIPNGDFSRWLAAHPAGRPAGWLYQPGEWYPTALNPSPGGGPLPLATRSRTCALYKASGSTTADVIISHALPGTLDGVWVACSAWVFIPGDSGLASVELNLRRTGGLEAGEVVSGQFAAQKNVWIRLQTVFFMHPSTEQNELLLHGIVQDGSNPRAFYVADVQANVGLVTASHTFVPPANVFPEYYVDGRRIQYGDVKPATGTARVGDIVYNTAPAVGQPVGWVCTAEPDTWKGFGVVLSS